MLHSLDPPVFPCRVLSIPGPWRWALSNIPRLVPQVSRLCGGSRQIPLCILACIDASSRCFSLPIIQFPFGRFGFGACSLMFAGDFTPLPRSTPRELQVPPAPARTCTTALPRLLVSHILVRSSWTRMPLDQQLSRRSLRELRSTVGGGG